MAPPSCTSFPPCSDSFKELEGAAFSANSFNCFPNLKIKEQQRHLQGGARFRKGLCSQQAQGWSGVGRLGPGHFPGPLHPTQHAGPGICLPFSSAAPSSTLEAGDLSGRYQVGRSPKCVMRRGGLGALALPLALGHHSQCPQPALSTLSTLPGGLEGRRVGEGGAQRQVPVLKEKA